MPTRARHDARHASRSRPKGKLGHESEPEPLRVARAEGSLVFDEHGKRHIDLTAGWCVGNLGWGRDELVDAPRKRKGPEYVSPHLQHAPWDALAEELCAIAPGRMQRAFRATGGSEAVDMAMQAAMRATGRRRFLSIDGCYHGNTLATLALADDAPKGAGVAGKRIKPPLDERALGTVETALKKRDVAAVVLEPIAMNLGVEIPAPEFMHGLEQLCREHGTLLVADEVACGFGRTGKLFASEHYGLEPDMVCLAKGLTGGAAPMGALLMTKDVADEIEGDFRAYSTYGWHPLAVDVALASLAYWRRHGAAILRNVEARGDQIQARLEEMPFDGEPEVRVKGLAAAVHLDDEKYAESIASRCRRRGVLVAASEDLVQLFPALTIEEALVDEAMDVLAGCV